MGAEHSDAGDRGLRAAAAGADPVRYGGERLRLGRAALIFEAPVRRLTAPPHIARSQTKVSASAIFQPG
jgi:hypothetical protein